MTTINRSLGIRQSISSLFPSSRRAFHQSIIRPNETPSSSSTSELGPSEKLTQVLGRSLEKENASQARSAENNAGSGALYGNVVKQAEFRPFVAGQTYSPTRLVSDSLFRLPPKYRKPAYLGPSASKARQSDPFHILSVNPVNEAINPDLARSYISQMGKIKTRAETGLTWKNQRRVGKMVRRARAMGLISRWSDQIQQPQVSQGY